MRAKICTHHYCWYFALPFGGLRCLEVPYLVVVFILIKRRLQAKSWLLILCKLAAPWQHILELHCFLFWFYFFLICTSFWHILFGTILKPLWLWTCIFWASKFEILSGLRLLHFEYQIGDPKFLYVLNCNLWTIEVS